MRLSLKECVEKYLQSLKTDIKANCVVKNHDNLSLRTLRTFSVDLLGFRFFLLPSIGRSCQNKIPKPFLLIMRPRRHDGEMDSGSD